MVAHIKLDTCKTTLYCESSECFAVKPLVERMDLLASLQRCLSAAWLCSAGSHQVQPPIRGQHKRDYHKMQEQQPMLQFAAVNACGSAELLLAKGASDVQHLQDRRHCQRLEGPSCAMVGGAEEPCGCARQGAASSLSSQWLR